MMHRNGAQSAIKQGGNALFCYVMVREINA
ncbi:hypothetical protein SAMN02744775_00321 [Enterobacter sp. CC120223-11]|nr:hypothetical protein SAMN02744775_00321 [Enterobacter sp. CC120223-11]